MIAVIRAHQQGRQLQYSSHGAWFDVEGTPLFNFATHDYRIKPEPRLRPWKPEEVPMPAVLRSRDGQIRWLILSVSMCGVATANSTECGQTAIASFEALRECNEHSTDGGKTWHPCGVEE